MSADTIDLTIENGYGTPGRRKNNWTATRRPIATDDETDLWEVGSRWLDTITQTIWECVTPATGAAVWVAGASATVSGAERVVLHPETDPPEPVYLDGDWLYLPAEDWD